MSSSEVRISPIPLEILVLIINHLEVCCARATVRGPTNFWSLFYWKPSFSVEKS